MKYHCNGVAYRQSTHETDRRRAERALQRKLGEIGMGSFNAPSVERIRVAELADNMLRDYRINDRKSLALTEQRWKKHLKPVLGDRRAVQITTDVLSRYVDQRRGQGAQNGTINRELAALKRMFNLAHRSSPRKVCQVPVFPHLKENPPRKGFMDDSQYRQLCQNCKQPWLRAMLALAYSYGFRKEELLSMRASQVDLLDRTIRLDPGTTKNGEGRVVYMTDEVYHLLCECLRGKQPTDYLLTREGNEPVRDMRAAWYALCERSGVGGFVCPSCSGGTFENRRCVTCGKVWKRTRLKYKGLIVHDMRRSAVRNMVRSGVPERVAMTISGHRTRSVFDRYNIVNEADLREAARRIQSERQFDFGHSDGHSGEPAKPKDGKQLHV